MTWAVSPGTLMCMVAGCEEEKRLDLSTETWNMWGKCSKLRMKTFHDLRQNYKNKHFAQLMPWLKSASLIQNTQKLLLITPVHGKCNSPWCSTAKISALILSSIHSQMQEVLYKHSKQCHNSHDRGHREGGREKAICLICSFYYINIVQWDSHKALTKPRAPVD